MKGKFKSWFIVKRLQKMCRYMDRHGIQVQDFIVGYDCQIRSFYARSTADYKVGYNRGNQ